MRAVLKRCIQILALILTVPAYAVYRALALISDPDAVFQSFSQLFSLIPGTSGKYLRAAFYRLACPGTSQNISIGFLTILSHRDTTLEAGVYIGPQCNIGKCRIGANTLIGSGVHIVSGKRQHEYSDPDRPIQEQGGRFEKIVIGEDCWLGNQALVMADIGAHGIVAAGSVVNRATGPYDIVAGNPARVVGSRAPQHAEARP